MKKIVSETNIGKYTISVDEDGALQAQALDMREPLFLDAGQAQALFQWLSTTRSTTAQTVQQAEPQAEVEARSPQDVVSDVISNAIYLARNQYPASLEPENRDRFIEQIARNPDVKPLISQGKVSRKQITLLVEQRLSI